MCDLTVSTFEFSRLFQMQKRARFYLEQRC